MQKDSKYMTDWVDSVVNLHKEEKMPEPSPLFYEHVMQAISRKKEIFQPVAFNQNFYLKVATVAAIISLNIFTLSQLFLTDSNKQAQSKNIEREDYITQLRSDYYVESIDIWENYE